MAAVSQQKPPQISTTVTENGKVVKTYSQPLPEFSVDINQMKMALVAAKAMEEGKDAAQAAKAERDRQQAEKQEYLDARRYMIAIANKGRGHFEELSTQELLDVMAITEAPPVDMEAFRKNIGGK